MVPGSNPGGPTTFIYLEFLKIRTPFIPSSGERIETNGENYDEYVWVRLWLLRMAHRLKAAKLRRMHRDKGEALLGDLPDLLLRP